MTASKPVRTSIELLGDKGTALEVKKLCPYNNHFIVLIGSRLWVYKSIPNQNDYDDVTTFHMEDFDITGMECLSDERIRLVSNYFTLILDADDIINNRYHPSRFFTGGDLSSSSKMYQYGNELIFKKVHA